MERRKFILRGSDVPLPTAPLPAPAAAAAAWLRALIGPDTQAVVVLQNGVEHAERVRDYVGDTPILPSTPPSDRAS